MTGVARILASGYNQFSARSCFVGYTSIKARNGYTGYTITSGTQSGHGLPVQIGTPRLPGLQEKCGTHLSCGLQFNDGAQYTHGLHNKNSTHPRLAVLQAGIRRAKQITNMIFSIRSSFVIRRPPSLAAGGVLLAKPPRHRSIARSRRVYRFLRHVQIASGTMDLPLCRGQRGAGVVSLLPVAPFCSHALLAPLFGGLLLY